MSSLLQSSLLMDLGSAGVLLALLLAGHALGDFVFQTRTMVLRKQETRWLASHIGEVTICHAVLLAPFLSWSAMLAAAAIGLAHWGIDWLKARVSEDESRALLYFALDQLAHLIVLVAAWWVLVQWGTPLWPTAQGFAYLIGAGAMTIAAYGFNVNGGAAIVALVSNRLASPGDDGKSPHGAGWTIGILERMLLLTFVLLGQWIPLGLIVAAKSLWSARSQESARGDAVLAGTLCSALIAVVSGLVIRILV